MANLFCVLFLFVLCIAFTNGDSFYINGAADDTSTDCSETSPCRSFSQVLTTFPNATAYELNVAPGVYGNNTNVGLVFTVPVSIQPYSLNGSGGMVIIDAGDFEGAVIYATSSLAVSGITMVANATATAQTILLSVNSLQPVTLQQVNLTTTGFGIGLSVSSATNISLLESSVTSASIDIAGESVTISNTVFANTAYPAITLNNVSAVVIDSSQFNFAEIVASFCDEISLSHSVFNSPPNTADNLASFLSEHGHNMQVNNVSMTVTEPSQFPKNGLELPTLQGNLTVDSFRLSGPYSAGIIANGVSTTISNINISDTTHHAITVQVDNFYLSQFYFSNCALGVSYLGKPISAVAQVVKVNEGTVNNAIFFVSQNFEANVSPGEFSNVQFINNSPTNSTTVQLISLSPGSWLLSNLTATSTVAQSTSYMIYGNSAGSEEQFTVEMRGINLSGFTFESSVMQFETPALNLTITDSTFSNLSSSINNDAGNIIDGTILSVGAVIYIDNCVFRDSQIAAITTVNSTLVDIRNSVFSNIAHPKLYMSSIVGFYGATSISVANSSFVSNSFEDGALSVTSTLAAVVSNCTFNHNIGEISGGFTSYWSVFTVSGSTFTNNTVSGNGGAISGTMYDTIPTNATWITDTVFTGNNGSGVYLTGGIQTDQDSYWTVSVGDLTFNDNTEYAIKCVNGVTVEYQGPVSINGEDSKDDISGCSVTENSSLSEDGPGTILIVVIVVALIIILTILGVVVAAVVIMKRKKRSSYVALDDE